MAHTKDSRGQREPGEVTVTTYPIKDTVEPPAPPPPPVLEDDPWEDDDVIPRHPGGHSCTPPVTSKGELCGIISTFYIFGDIYLILDLK